MSEKVVVHFRPVGSTPALKQSKFKINTQQRFQTVIDFLRKQLHLQPSDSLFLYVNSAFAPAPDQLLANLNKCYSIDGTLVVNYCSTPAWG